MRCRSLPCFFCSSLIFGCISCIAFEERSAFTVRGNISVLTMMVKAMMPIPALENRVARLFKRFTRKSTYWFQIGMLTPGIVGFVSPPASSGVVTCTCACTGRCVDASCHGPARRYPGVYLPRDSRLRNRIVSATAKWIAAQDTPDGHSATGKDTVPRHGLVAILRATRDVAAGGREQWRDRLPVECDDQESQPRRWARRISWQERRGAIV